MAFPVLLAEGGYGHFAQSVCFFTLIFALLAILQLQRNISHFQDSQSHGAAQRIAIQIHQPHPKGRKQEHQVEKKPPHVPVLVGYLSRVTAAAATRTTFDRSGRTSLGTAGQTGSSWQHSASRSRALTDRVLPTDCVLPSAQASREIKILGTATRLPNFPAVV